MAARELHLYNLHTFETVKAVYWRDGAYIPEGLARISYHLRDFRTGGIKPIDPTLLNIVHQLSSHIDVSGPINVISGYRTPATNAMLAARSSKVAPNSFHMRARPSIFACRDLRPKAFETLRFPCPKEGLGIIPSPTSFIWIPVPLGPGEPLSPEFPCH